MHGGATETGAPLPSFQPEALDAALHQRATRLREFEDDPSHPEVITDSSARRYSRVLDEKEYDVWHLSEAGIDTLKLLRESDPSLLELKLGQVRAGSAGAAALAGAIASNTVLQKLDFSCNELSDIDMGAFAEVLEKNSALTALSFYSNFQPNAVDSAVGVVRLAGALARNTTLTDLSLGHCFVGDEGAAALGEALRVNTTLRILNLENCSIPFTGLRSLLAGLAANTTLTHIDLQGLSDGDVEEDVVQAVIALSDRIDVTLQTPVTHFISMVTVACRKLVVDDAARRAAQAALAAPETEAGAAAAEGGAPLGGDDGADAERPAKVRRT